VAKKETVPPDRPIVLTGVIRGCKTIELDEESFLPDGYRVTLHLILEPGEGLRLAAGAWADMTPEEEDDLEKTLSELRGRPMNIPRIEREP
jgi:hypothetical protein